MRLSLPLSRPGRSILLLAVLAVSCSSQGPATNFALRHRAYHSSAMDYNATSQLAVDGIIETEAPYWIEVSGNDDQLLSIIEHDIPFDPRPWTTVTAEGPHAELSVRTHGFRESVDQITMTFSASLRDGRQQGPYSARLLSQDGAGQWKVENISRESLTESRLRCPGTRRGGWRRSAGNLSWRCRMLKASSGRSGCFSATASC